MEDVDAVSDSDEEAEEERKSVDSDEELNVDTQPQLAEDDEAEQATGDLAGFMSLQPKLKRRESQLLAGAAHAEAPAKDSRANSIIANSAR